MLVVAKLVTYKANTVERMIKEGWVGAKMHVLLVQILCSVTKKLTTIKMLNECPVKAEHILHIEV